MKKDLIITLILLFISSIAMGTNGSYHFYCNPRMAFPIFFIIVAMSSYWAPYYFSKNNNKIYKVLEAFFVPTTSLSIMFIGVALGYFTTSTPDVEFIEFLQYNNSFIYAINIFLLLSCLSIITTAINIKERYRILFSIAISTFLCGLSMLLFFKTPTFLNTIITSPITTIIELIIVVICFGFMLSKK